MGIVAKILNRDKPKLSVDLQQLLDLDIIDTTSNSGYLKKMALETCINFIGRTISKSDFRIVKNGKRQYDDWHYLLNVRPNKNQSAAEFWQDFVYKLIFENEVLVILTDDNDLLIADSFDREEYAVFPDAFKSVIVKDYEFKRTFRMDEVIYMTYNNEKLTSYMDGMFKDYAELFNRMIEAQMLNGQIRGIIPIDSVQSLDAENQKKLQDFINKLYSSFSKKLVALVPKLKGFDYEEISKNSNSNTKSVEELTKLKTSLVDDVANILGIPTALVRGDMAEYETAIKAYFKFCINPLVQKFEDELNAKIIEKSDYLKGHKIQVRGLNEKDPLELAVAIDKLVGSGVYNRNEIREKTGDEPVDNPALDEYVLTKNYASVEGGEKNETQD